MGLHKEVDGDGLDGRYLSVSPLLDWKVTVPKHRMPERLMAETFDKNMIDKDEYPQTAELEMRCVNMLGRLWNSPDADEATGCSTTGSSEAAMLGGLALKRRWQQKRRAAGESTERP